MNANDITTKRFGKATFNGYNTDDVDAFLREVSQEFSQLTKERSELERKLEVLADKIREYRDDEDALKDALLLAKKQGNAMIAEAKETSEQLKAETEEECEKLREEAQQQHDTQIAEAQAQHDKLVSEGEEYKAKLIRETNERADALIKDARAKAEDMRKQMNDEREKLEKILLQTRKEVYDYRARVDSLFKSHMELFQQIPEKVENDFVKKTAEEAEKREQAAEKQAAEKQAAVNSAAEKAEVFAEPKTTVIPPVAEPKAAEKPAEKAEVSDNQPEQTASQELPFFNSAAEPKVRHTDLLFGQKNNGNS